MNNSKRQLTTVLSGTGSKLATAHCECLLICALQILLLTYLLAINNAMSHLFSPPSIFTYLQLVIYAQFALKHTSDFWNP